jgi:DNA-directed RNA polymerase subunit alpha
MILKQHFSLFVDFEEPIDQVEEEEEDKEKARIRALLEKSVEEMELSVRSANCLRAAEIKSIADLVVKPESAMLKYRNFGRKSLKEISDILGEMGLSFGMDISPYMKQTKKSIDLGAPRLDADEPEEPEAPEDAGGDEEIETEEPTTASTPSED